METKVNYTLVGGFVLSIALAIIASILWLSKVGDNQNATYFTVYFRQHSLSGLQKDSYVLMKGIKIGSVSAYNVSPRNIEEVKVILRLEQGTPVKTDTRAIVSRNLLTGLATIELVGGTQESAFLELKSPDEEYPVIPEGTSTIDKLTDSVPAFLDQVGDAVERVQLFASDENIRAFQKTLQHIEQVTESLAQNRQQIDSVLKSIEVVAKDIASISGEVGGFTKRTDQRVANLSREAEATLKEMQTTFEQLQGQIRVVSGSFQNASQVFSYEMVSIAQSINDAAGSIAKTVEAFEDPRGIITGPRENALGPGEQLSK